MSATKDRVVWLMDGDPLVFKGKLPQRILYVPERPDVFYMRSIPGKPSADGTPTLDLLLQSASLDLDGLEAGMDSIEAQFAGDKSFRWLPERAAQIASIREQGCVNKRYLRLVDESVLTELGRAAVMLRDRLPEWPKVGEDFVQTGQTLTNEQTRGHYLVSQAVVTVAHAFGIGFRRAVVLLGKLSADRAVAPGALDGLLQQQDEDGGAAA